MKKSLFIVLLACFSFFSALSSVSAQNDPVMDFLNSLIKDSTTHTHDCSRHKSLGRVEQERYIIASIREIAFSVDSKIKIRTAVALINADFCDVKARSLLSSNRSFSYSEKKRAAEVLGDHVDDFIELTYGDRRRPITFLENYKANKDLTNKRGWNEFVEFVYRFSK